MPQGRTHRLRVAAALVKPMALQPTLACVGDSANFPRKSKQCHRWWAKGSVQTKCACCKLVLEEEEVWAQGEAGAAALLVEAAGSVVSSPAGATGPRHRGALPRHLHASRRPLPASSCTTAAVLICLLAHSAALANRPANPVNLTVWALRPLNLSTTLSNRDSADQAGDIFFYLTDRLVAPYACRVTHGKEWFCDEQGTLTHDSVYTQTVIEVDGSWPNASAHGKCRAGDGHRCYAACNPSNKNGSEWSCGCSDTDSDRPPCDVNGRAFMDARYPDCADGCRSPTSDLWKSDVSLSLGGIWYSTTAEADCDNRATEACMWRQRETVKTANASCVNSRLLAAVEAHDDAGAGGAGCFARCSPADRANRTSTCWTVCAFQNIIGRSRSFPALTRAGMSRDALIDPWTKAFTSDDPNQGGCPPIASPADTQQ